MIQRENCVLQDILEASLAYKKPLELKMKVHKSLKPG